MKKLLSLLVFTILVVTVSFAQESFRGMKYQAVARDLKGEVLADRKIELRINLKGNLEGAQQVFYSELHNVVTNQLGLFNLVVGQGRADNGAFDKVPWSSTDIWMEVEIRMEGKIGFSTISNSQLLAVPYAFHALTAGEVIGEVLHDEGQKKFDWTDRCPCEQGIAQVKLLYLGPSGVTIKAFGNKNLNPNTLDSTFTNVVNGQILVLNARVPDGKLKNETFFQIIGALPAIPVIEVPTSCDEQFVGENFGNFSILSHKDKKNGSECTVCDVRMDWKLNGNALLDMCSKIGTRSYTDFIFITNNLERMKITKDGHVNISNNLTVGGNTTSQGNLTVNGTTNTNGNLNANGVTNVNNTLSATNLIIRNDVTLNTTGGQTINNGPLTVNGPTTLQGPANFNNSINITQNVGDGNWLATLTNINNEGGDGMKIRLGKSKSIYTPPVLGGSPVQIADISEFIGCGTNVEVRAAAMLRILASEADEVLRTIAGMAVGAGNMLINFLNSQLHIPGFQLTPPFTAPQAFLTLLDAILLDAIPDANLDDLNIPAINFPTIDFPDIPQINLGAIGIPAIDFTVPSFWGVPNICAFLDNNVTPLNNQNEFIRFSDKDDSKVGSIRGMSVADWTSKYWLNPLYLSDLYDAITSSKLDKLHARYHLKLTVSKAMIEYAKLGVEYSSGNGDYAEWLERKDIKEYIAAGDIIGVIGGKITKDLECAEQVMVVSHKPIVLGNVPEEGKSILGNIIAFMGQVPVKVTGPVMSGDYIVGQFKTPGYGIAKHPNEMTIEDFKYAVGRAWDTNLSRGPKMVNTVVGVHNGDYFKILKRFESKMNESDNRLKNLENKVNQLLNIAPETKAKKPF